MAEKVIDDYRRCRHFFFIGVAGTGMSAIAQFLSGVGFRVSGSDRLFNTSPDDDLRHRLQRAGVECFAQASGPDCVCGISEDVDAVVASTAIESTNPEIARAASLGIPVMHRSQLLAQIALAHRTIAVGGTSGKSTTTAMIFHILNCCGLAPSLITGAGLVSLQQQGLIGNAFAGRGAASGCGGNAADAPLLVIEADESDGSIVGYRPCVSVLLNVERDHKEEGELLSLFSQFKANTSGAFITNRSNRLAAGLSSDAGADFSSSGEPCGFQGSGFRQEGFSISFSCQGVAFRLPLIGRHNMENALAATAVCSHFGLSAGQCAKALESYHGIFRRTQVVGQKNGVFVVDDFAHNPQEVACAIRACQSVGKRVLAWFQPHGFGPLAFMHNQLVQEVRTALRPQDVFLLSDVFYAGGTVSRSVTSADVAAQFGPEVVYESKREDLLPFFAKNAVEGDVVLVMGARDTTLTSFANSILSVIG